MIYDIKFSGFPSLKLFIEDLFGNLPSGTLHLVICGLARCYRYQHKTRFRLPSIRCEDLIFCSSPRCVYVEVNLVCILLTI